MPGTTDSYAAIPQYASALSAPCEPVPGANGTRSISSCMFSQLMITSAENVLVCFRWPYSLLLFGVNVFSSCVAGVSVCFLQAEKAKTEIIVTSTQCFNKRPGNDFMMIKFSVEKDVGMIAS